MLRLEAQTLFPGDFFNMQEEHYAIVSVLGYVMQKRVTVTATVSVTVKVTVAETEA